MTVIVSDSIENKGKESARRHREKRREEIKKGLPGIIADESIITKKKGRIVKVPIRSLQNERFRQGKRRENEDGDDEGQGSGGVGVGQGSGKKGDIIGQRPADQSGRGAGKAGNEPGEEYIESEFEIEELIEMMLEDLELPNLQEKDIKEMEVIFGIKIKDIVKHGPQSLLHSKKSAKEGMRRFWFYLNYLESLLEETCPDITDERIKELIAFMALKEKDGILADAEALIQDADGVFIKRAKKDIEDGVVTEVDPFIIIETDDLRYRKLERDISYKSRAVIIAAMDVSASMSDMKKYLVRATLFWFIEFLRKLYEEVEVRFIVHHTKARFVPEEDFFRTVESGGTNCWTAYDAATDMLETKYPVSSWNRYVFHFSDGEDFDPASTIREIQRLKEKGVQMIGYGEIDIDGVAVSEYNLYSLFKKELPVTELNRKENDDLQVIIGNQNFPFVGVVLTGKEDILPAIRQFLKKGRFDR
ncbi:MAG: hypothetical protein COU47_01145 [Candidatus Niyogibacteria bacterium CG10_big_fil_rev_8_21_14_0_10_46_36]|uniref:Uncharacterized protein n=1 Tax=Candidatus Niyogibacteria bacterium CG10_big_fil_rev_8_21_14_0_10_46_36 TaxID=1974726 RepID=A0A2H0TDQ1_9BACT|nr:MAG: hypothetical protein COU47_01145 [Candidatus Niyogibacteria bacterium CG10_big_fil_rev_8_21_14_0_10_46_36]